MPDKDGKLSQAEMQVAIGWLSERQATGACPLCASENWTVVDQLVTVPAFNPRAAVSRSGFPAVLIMCMRCTFFRMHSAVIMELVSKDDEPKPEEAKHVEG